MLAFWLGGASSFVYIEPPIIPEQPHGGGAQRGYEGEPIGYYDDEDMAMLIPMFITVMEC
jgi:hypothetical protein